MAVTLVTNTNVKTTDDADDPGINTTNRGNSLALGLMLRSTQGFYRAPSVWHKTPLSATGSWENSALRSGVPQGCMLNPLLFIYLFSNFKAFQLLCQA